MIEVFYATNRNILAEGDTPRFGNAFNERGPHWLRFGSAEVAKRGRDYEVRRIRLEPETIPAEPDVAPRLGSLAVFEALRERMAKRKTDVICLLHGYATDIETALARAAEIKDKYRPGGEEADVFVFSWPSDGAMAPFISYYSDRDDARASGLAIARAFLKLCDFLAGIDRERYCDRSIHLVAHSMGNYALRHAVQAIRRELGDRLPRLFETVFLMAADEDDDAFEYDHKLRRLPDLARSVQVYFTPDDRALLISDATKRNPDRLGANGPRIRDGIPRKVVLVDCSRVDVSRDDLANHQYYRLRAEVIADVNAVLAGRAPGEIPNRDAIIEDRSFRIRPRRKRSPGTPRRRPSR